MNSLPWWRKIRYRVLIFGLLMSIFPLLALGIVNINNTWTDLERSIHRQNMASVRWIAKDIDQLINSSITKIELTTSAFADLTKETKTQQEIVLFSLLKEVDEIEEMALLNKSNSAISRVSKREVLPLAENDSNLDLLVQKTQYGSVYFTKDGRPMMNVFIPLWNKQENERSGTLKVKLSLRGIIQKTVGAESGGYYFVVDSQGNLIGHQDFSQVLKSTQVTTSEAVRKLLAQVSPLEVTAPLKYKTYDNTLVLGAFAPVSNLNWGVVIEQPVKEAMVPIYQLVYKLLAVMGGLMFTVIGLSIYFGLRFTKPIEKLEAGTRIIASGNLDHLIAVKGDGEVAKLVEAFNNMTRELKLKSQNLLKEKELLDKVVSGAGVGMALIKDDCTLSWANAQLRSWFGLRDIAGQKCFQVLGEGNNYCQPCLARKKQGDTEISGDMITSVLVKGEKKYFRHQVFALNPSSPDDPRYLELIEDITARREMEAMVIQADKLAAVGLLASGVAHEINNPLATINAYAQDLIERLQEQKDNIGGAEQDQVQVNEIIADLNTITEQVGRCGQITRSLLNFSRQSDWKLEPVDLNKLIQETIKLLGYRFKKSNIQLLTSLEAKLPIINGSPIHLQQVLFNILINSVDALEAGGQIEITTRKKLHWVEVMIRDNGSGIKEEYLAKIFDPFFTTKPIGKGTGLGLSICYGIISNLKGEIKVDSEAGKGTKVIILLPANGETDVR
ncbi:MAG: hypothetical protein VR72_12815 [Clostridiaceae bacterium BRH_c20a]|nr:MAG: hypothetical protein VR72_12815 [Clostridiaceae bacterium BRH_c20a]